MHRLRISTLAIACAALLGACAHGASAPGNAANVVVDTASKPLYDPKSLPAGGVGDSIRLGHDIIVDTNAHLAKNIKVSMSCEACHPNAGTVKRAGSFVGLYGRYPQWNKRAHRVITLQDRIAECFLYSMNGTPPAYSSREMIAIVSYVAYLSRNVPVGTPQAKDDRFLVPLPSAPPDVHHGAALYAQKCQMCHGADGAGSTAFPPLWGPKAFNQGAGMAHIDRMAGFVRYNMPKNAPGSLSMNDAYDVAQFILNHDRPKFDKSRLIQPLPAPASYF
jgi:thiosulfate dehydrogenase